MINGRAFSQVEGFDSARVRFVLNEAPSAGPDASIARLGGGGAIDVSCEGDEAEPFAFVCTAALASIEGLEAGAYDFLVVARDAAGNEVRISERFVLDLSPPEVAAQSVSTSYVPSLSNPRIFAEVAAADTTVILQFAVSELLGDAATARVPQLGVAFERDPAASIGQLQTFTLVPGAAAAEGSMDVELELVDTVGNAAVLTLADAINVDVSPPDAVLTDGPGDVRFSRVPWGDRADSAVRFSLSATAGSAEAGAQIVVTSGPAFNSTRLGVLLADDEGAFAGALVPQDVARVFLHQVDLAGNVSAAARVRDVEWTASLGNKRRGDTLANPNTLFETTRFFQALDPLTRDEVDEPAAFADPLSSASLFGAGEFVLRRTTPINSQALLRPGVIFHRRRGEILQFGGQPRFGVIGAGELVRFRNGGWEVVDTFERPSGDGHGFAYDDKRDLAFVQGGDGTWVLLDATFVRLDATQVPGSTQNGVLVFDRTFDRLVYMTRVARTFVAPLQGVDPLDLNASQLIWEEITDGPVNRDGALFFDPGRARVRYYGGENNGTPGGEIFSLDESAWTLDATLAPRTAHVIVRDEAADAMLVLGGYEVECGFECFVFSSPVLLDGDTLNAIRFGPVPTAGLFGAAVDPVANTVIVSGGFYGEVGIAGPNAEARSHRVKIDARVWTELEEDPIAFPIRNNHEIYYDATAQRIVIHGGEILSGAAGISSQTEAFANNAISLLDSGTSLTFGRIFFDGGAMNMVNNGLRLRFAGNNWVETNIGRSNTAASFDGTSALLVDVGTSPPETLRFLSNGATTLVTATGLPDLAAATMTYDEVNARATLLETSTGRTFFFDGASTWTAGPANGPVLNSTELHYDGVRDRVVAVGTDAGGLLRVFDLVVTSDDAQWVQNAVPPPPGRRPEGSSTYDTDDGSIVYHGGVEGSSLDDVWRFDGGATAMPAYIFDVRFAETGALDAEIEELLVSATASGRGFNLGGSAADAVDGVQVWAWRGEWLRAGPAQSTANVEVDLVAALGSAELIRNGSIFIALTPAAANGSGGVDGGARVSLSALEVRATYREP